VACRASNLRCGLAGHYCGQESVRAKKGQSDTNRQELNKNTVSKQLFAAQLMKKCLIRVQRPSRLDSAFDLAYNFQLTALSMCIRYRRYKKLQVHGGASAAIRFSDQFV